MKTDSLKVLFLNYLTEYYDTELVSDGTQLRVYFCPECQRTTDAKVYVSVSKGVGICFHCGFSFNPISFIQAVEGCSVGKAKQILESNLAPLSLPSPPQEAVPRKLPIPETKPLSPKAYNYCIGRNLTNEMILNAGLRSIVQDLKYGDKMLPTKDRLFIPVYYDDKIVGWQARSLKKDDTIRYITSPTFKTNKYLYNYDNVSCGDFVILTEGVFDVFGWQRITNNVVATFGKKISDIQIELLIKLDIKTLYIAWDNDAVRQKHDLAKKCQHLFNIKMIEYPDDLDADELSTEVLYECWQTASAFDWNNSILSLLKAL